MDFGIKKMSVEDAAKATLTEGGAVVGGLFVAGFAGKQLENIVKKDVLPTSPLGDKLIALGANLVPKVAMYLILKGQGERGLGGYGKDMGKGALASIVLDGVIRAGNDFAPKSVYSIKGYSVLGEKLSAPQSQETTQKLLQENSSLRQQLNGALQRIASASPNVTVTPVQTAFPPDHDRQYGMMQSTPEAEDRRKKFGAMTPPIEDERNRKYGAMDRAKLNFAGETESIASAYGML